MVPAKKGNDHPALEEVHDLFERWRRGKKRRDPIPETLWRAAVSLTEVYSVNEVARYLHLSHKDLKARSDTPITFVELDLLTVPAECTVEIEKPSGERMRIRGTCNAIDLARVFLA
mgnify:CR=1 FL=1